MMDRYIGDKAEETAEEAASRLEQAARLLRGGDRGAANDAIAASTQFQETILRVDQLRHDLAAAFLRAGIAPPSLEEANKLFGTPDSPEVMYRGSVRVIEDETLGVAGPAVIPDSHQLSAGTPILDRFPDYTPIAASTEMGQTAPDQKTTAPVQEVGSVDRDEKTIPLTDPMENDTANAGNTEPALDADKAILEELVVDPRSKAERMKRGDLTELQEKIAYAAIAINDDRTGRAYPNYNDIVDVVYAADIANIGTELERKARLKTYVANMAGSVERIGQKILKYDGLPPERLPFVVREFIEAARREPEYAAMSVAEVVRQVLGEDDFPAKLAKEETPNAGNLPAEAGVKAEEFDGSTADNPPEPETGEVGVLTDTQVYGLARLVQGYSPYLQSGAKVPLTDADIAEVKTLIGEIEALNPAIRTTKHADLALDVLTAFAADGPGILEAQDPNGPAATLLIKLSGLQDPKKLAYMRTIVEMYPR